jgi:hypothetical protein
LTTRRRHAAHMDSILPIAACTDSHSDGGR